MSPIGVPVSREAWDHLSSLEGFDRALREIATAALQTWKDVDTYTLRNIITDNHIEGSSIERYSQVA
jgi:hypothetical protein